MLRIYYLLIKRKKLFGRPNTSSSLLLTIKWCDKGAMYMLFSFHNEEFVDTKRHYHLSKNDSKTKVCCRL